MGPYQFKHGEYQNAAIWTWLSGWEAQARAKVGDRETALKLIQGCFCPTCDRIYEWIDPRTGDRYNPDFATGAGSLLSALAAVEKLDRQVGAAERAAVRPWIFGSAVR